MNDNKITVRNDDQQGASEEKTPSETHILSSEGSCREDIFFVCARSDDKIFIVRKVSFRLIRVAIMFFSYFFEGFVMKRTFSVAALLCFFLGIIGAHRFYMGYTGTGILQLFTLGGLGLWTLIDFIRILTGGMKDKDGNDLER